MKLLTRLTMQACANTLMHAGVLVGVLRGRVWAGKFDKARCWCSGSPLLYAAGRRARYLLLFLTGVGRDISATVSGARAPTPASSRARFSLNLCETVCFAGLEIGFACSFKQFDVC